MEAAVILVQEFLCFTDDPMAACQFWENWELVSVAWRRSVFSSREVAVARLLVRSSVQTKVRLWRRVLSVPDTIDEEEFNSVLMDGAYSSWAEIARDSRRTFASILRTRPGLHLQLTRILHALATRFKDVGYCQGMNFVACSILLAVTGVDNPDLFSAPSRQVQEPDVEAESPRRQTKEAAPDSFIAVIQTGNPDWHERVSFKICEKLFVRNHFVRLYELGLHTRLTIWTFDKLVESLFPSLHQVINHRLQVSADFYTSTWFITLFSADLDLKSSIRILDIFIAKGQKALHRFGLACLASQVDRLLEERASEDVAEGLRLLRSSAASAVAECGMEPLIFRSLTDYKCITNRLISDLQTAGKVHGGASLVFVTDKDTLRKSGIVVPAVSDTSGGDSSPSGAALEAEWNKEEAAIRLQDSTGAAAPVNRGILGKMGKIGNRIRRVSVSTEVPKVDAPDEETHEETGELSGGLNSSMLPRRGNSVSPEKKNSSHRPSATKALKSLKKKLGSIIPHSATKGYSRA